MRDFGTFDTLTDEEDTLYNRLAFVRREQERLDYERNDATQDIKLYYHKMDDDKFKIKFWLVFALIFGFMALPWYRIILAAIPPEAPFMLGYIFNIIASVIAMVSQFVMLPLFVVCLVIFIVRVVLHLLRNGKKEASKKLAESVGIQNRQILIGELKLHIKECYEQEMKYKEEEERLERRLRMIRREREG